MGLDVWFLVGCFRLLPYFMCANYEGSGETARMRKACLSLSWSPMWQVPSSHELTRFSSFIFSSHISGIRVKIRSRHWKSESLRIVPLCTDRHSQNGADIIWCHKLLAMAYVSLLWQRGIEISVWWMDVEVQNVWMWIFLSKGFFFILFDAPCSQGDINTFQEKILDPLNIALKMTVQPGGSTVYNGTTLSAGNKKSNKRKIDVSTSQSKKNNTTRSRLSKILTLLDKSGHNVMPVNSVKLLVIHRRYTDNDVLIWSSSKRRRSPILATWNAYYEPTIGQFNHQTLDLVICLV